MAPATPVLALLTGFKQLNSSTYIYEPPSTTTSTSTSTSSLPASTAPPDLILLLAWLDANPRHIAKYTVGYTALYPTARILLITTSLANVTLHTRSSEAARLAPALSLLVALPPDATILLHSFSNGGTYSAHLLARQYHARTGLALDVGAQILDSAPGRTNYGRAATALAFSLPKAPAILHYLSLAMLHLFLVAYYVTKTATGAQNKIEVMRFGLLDYQFWDVATPRAYVYSKEDKMVVWEDVLEHAGMSEEAGWKTVVVEEFEGSAHCAHLLLDEGKYWGFVGRVWGER